MKKLNIHQYNIIDRQGEEWWPQPWPVAILQMIGLFIPQLLLGNITWVGSAEPYLTDFEFTNKRAQEAHQKRVDNLMKQTEAMKQSAQILSRAYDVPVESIYQMDPTDRKIVAGWESDKLNLMSIRADMNFNGLRTPHLDGTIGRLELNIKQYILGQEMTDIPSAMRSE